MALVPEHLKVPHKDIILKAAVSEGFFMLLELRNGSCPRTFEGTTYLI